MNPPDFHQLRKSFPQNVGSLERWLSIAAGAALAGYGLTQQSRRRPLFATAGALLLARGASGRCPLYQSVGFSTADLTDDSTAVAYGKGIKVVRSITLQSEPAALYAFWRNLENLPRFMDHLESVKALDARRSHWIAKGPAGTTVEWDAEIINEIDGELIGWKTVGEPTVDHAGSVHFEKLKHGRGTKLTVILRYDPPGGKGGALVARLLGQDPELQIGNDLRKFQQILETGEVATVAGQTSGRSGESR